MSRRRTCDSAIVRKARDERKYGTKRQLRTEANRKRKRLNHFRRHPNNIKGVEKLREALGV